MTFSDLISCSSTETYPSIKTNDVHRLLENCPDTINTLSLDCFDTLLWRKVATPSDVFFNLQHKLPFHQIGLKPSSRAKAESDARKKNRFLKNTNEITLEDIYLSYDETLSKEALTALSEAELEAEKEACYAIPSMLELIKDAKKKGMDVIIVSDIYFTEKQLRSLLFHCLPENIYHMIDHVFCSCEHTVSKASGLFNIVLKKIQRESSQLWHIGDNKVADYIAPKALSIRSTHLIPYSIEVAEMLRLRSLSMAVLDQNIRNTRPLSNPFSGIFSTAVMPMHTPECTIGYLSLGPIMYAFSAFIQNQVEALQTKQKNPKILFLMRDGYLPSLAFQTFTGNNKAKRVCISRFTALAASFRTKEDINQYLSSFKSTTSWHEQICKQLLINKSDTKKIIEATSKSKNKSKKFLDLICKENQLKKICETSKKYRERLYRYLKKEADIQEKDTLLFVDLGYTGTAQGKLSPILKDDFDIDVIGCYLIASETPNWQKNRSGLIDPSTCDHRTSSSLVKYIALLEQLCTTNAASVIDYTEMGDPIFSETTLSKSQHTKLDLIQMNALEFIQDANSFNQWGRKIDYSMQMLRDYAIAEIGRLIFFPSTIEIEYLKSFKFELNMGAKNVFEMFNTEKGLEGLRKSGLYFMETGSTKMRTNYPAELRHTSIELSLLLLMQCRTGFDIRANDFSFREEKIEIALFADGKIEKAVISCKPTYDGYFALIVPIGKNEMNVGIFFGNQYESFQIQSVTTLPTSRLHSSLQEHFTQSANENMLYEGIEKKAGGLMLCQSEKSFLFYESSKNDWQENHVLRVIFRPIGVRATHSVSTKES